MSSGFVTETELAEARKKRQEEWEKVRQPDEPLGNSSTPHYYTYFLFYFKQFRIKFISKFSFFFS